ncbi:hypothetical protein JOC69_000681 [Heliobacterium gestii]|nr:hypothetical protein [Heliomicrobium gestii]
MAAKRRDLFRTEILPRRPFFVLGGALVRSGSLRLGGAPPRPA